MPIDLVTVFAFYYFCSFTQRVTELMRVLNDLNAGRYERTMVRESKGMYMNHEGTLHIIRWGKFESSSYDELNAGEFDRTVVRGYNMYCSGRQRKTKLALCMVVFYCSYNFCMSQN